MKFSELVEKYEKVVSKYGKGKDIKPHKLDKLQQLLEEKQSGYQERLDANLDPNKRKKLETRLKVVAAQIDKLKRLPRSD